jgi:hypothetical protein
MTRIALAATVAAGVLAAAIAAGPAGATAKGGLPCRPKITKGLGGKPTMELCGPATVTMTVNGKTYRFSQGFCESDSSQFQLTLGTLVASDHAHNGGKPYFSMFGKSTADLSARYGGKDLMGAGMTLVTIRGAGKDTGTFGNQLPTPKIHGSWNCHGVIVKT